MHVRMARPTYVGVPADLLKDVLAKVARVAKETAGDLVSVLETVEGGLKERHLTTLAKVRPRLLGGGVQVLDPAMVSSSSVVADVVLEDNNVGVGDLLCVDG